ncbi:DUF4159 domain-containing protein [Propylenella binzhouense]|uniref:DUF4159 domain-containing protein n=1 Tax=Propylenella binzhouense TaxID=2555902 RepID=A0A964T2H2_9HYPH|nr:DUF4159 domain-containing protein [Propylenella binzhouense]MYZ46727.1 DUF4159 domain-containing protein [Propylenella binzhouense]
MIGAVGFLAPWMLAALAALPIIWLILRLTPPKPRRIVFPPTRMLFGLDERENTPARTPWWLTALRLALIALLILALAEPILRPDQRLASGQSPLLLVLDNGWDTASDFRERVAVAETAVAEAQRDGRPVALVATADPRADLIAATDAATAARRLAAIEPQPYLPDRALAAERIANADGADSMDVLWIAGRIDDGGAAELAGVLDKVGRSARLLQSDRPGLVMLPPENAADAVHVPVVRFGAATDAMIAGFDDEGRRIVETQAAFADGDRAEGLIELPADLRNDLARLVVSGEASAGAVQLLDANWRRKSVGLVVGEAGRRAQPLLSPLTYVERALEPRADLLRPSAPGTSASLDQLMKAGASVIVLTETGNLPQETTEALLKWIEAGGTLVRFASSNISGSDERLLPVRLREGERALGGSLSWEEPQPIGSFPAAGAFGRIGVPKDVVVNRQVLADPVALEEAEVWAELRDGTPLVTARNQGRGRIVLFHVTAEPGWSNLPISGAFVEMLTAIVNTAGTIETGTGAAPRAANETAADSQPWRPEQVLDGYGRLGRPGPNAKLLAAMADARPGPDSPPGLYTRAGTLRALNAVGPNTALAPLDPVRLRWTGDLGSLEPGRAWPIWPYLLAAAALLAILDGLAVLWLSGRLVRRLAGTAALVLAASLLALPTERARAQSGAEMEAALTGTLQTRLAYVVTGDPSIDDTSRAGLEGLTRYLASRTALEPGEPVAIDIGTDELAFFSLLYWPIDATAPVPQPAVMARVDAFMKNGGTILFDTRDAGGAIVPGAGGTTPETQKLRAILAQVDVPPLEPVPPDHVLGKAFYLLRDFPGRWDTSQLWVESIGDTPRDSNRPVRGGDGVSPILITGNDFAAAWAIDENGRYLYPTVPADPRQRDMAFRTGVNIVMYCFTGNYKADQVHVPALLERLGQ